LPMPVERAELEQDSRFLGPDLTLVRINTVALVFNSAAFK
jgi:hypothetical protein